MVHALSKHRWAVFRTDWTNANTSANANAARADTNTYPYADVDSNANTNSQHIWHYLLLRESSSHNTERNSRPNG